MPPDLAEFENDEERECRVMPGKMFFREFSGF
jgi:hypothetical protein